MNNLESILLPVPFYANIGDGNQCVQATMQSVLKYFLNKDYSLAELDKLTGRKEGKWTFTSQNASALYDLGLKVKFYSREDIKPFLEGEPFFRRHFGKNADYMLQFLDLDDQQKAIKKLLAQHIFEQRVLSFSEIEEHLLQNHVPVMSLDWNKIIGKEDFYQGHSVTVTGFNKNNVFYHNSGPENPESNKKTPKSIFISAWDTPGTDNDVVIVFGKR